MKRTKKLMAELYQIAGHRLLIPDELTDGQRDRLDQLILDVLSDPGQWTAKLVFDAYRRAMKP